MTAWRRFAQDRRRKDEKYRERLRELLRSENDLTNHRTTWLLVTQALLAAAASNFLKDHPGITIGIAVIGIVVAVSIGFTLYNSLRARMHFKMLWRRRVAARGYDMNEILPLDGAVRGAYVKWWLCRMKYFRRS